jgi:uncharacterized membrane protein YkvA (DUF1232 family)
VAWRWFRYASAPGADIPAAEIESPARRPASDEASLRRKLWRKLLREAASIPFLEDVLTAHYCAFDRETPYYVKAVLVGAITYFIVPTDLIPDYIPVIGFSDDAAVVGAAVKIVASHIKPEHREAARRTTARLRGELPSRHR